MNAASGRVLDYFVTSNIIRLGEKYERYASRYLQQEKGINLSGWRLLVWLEQLIEPTRAQLQACINLSDSDFADLLDSFRQRKLVRELDDDRYVLTPEGDKLFDEVFPLIQAQQDLLTDDEDPDEISMLLEMLHRLEAKVDRMAEAFDTSQNS